MRVLALAGLFAVAFTGSQFTAATIDSAEAHASKRKHVHRKVNRSVKGTRKARLANRRYRRRYGNNVEPIYPSFSDAPTWAGVAFSRYKRFGG